MSAKASVATHIRTVSTDTHILIAWSQEENNEMDGIYVGFLPKEFQQEVEPSAIFVPEQNTLIVPRQHYADFDGGDSVEGLFLYYDRFTQKPVISFIAGGEGSPKKAIITGWLNGNIFQPCTHGAIRKLKPTEEVFDFNIEFWVGHTDADPKFVTTYGTLDREGGNNVVYADRHG
jgi:hypothetical protein